jgi:hypothetical protein
MLTRKHQLFGLILRECVASQKRERRNDGEDRDAGESEYDAPLRASRLHDRFVGR